MLEGREFLLFTHHKPLTSALFRIFLPWTARQQRHLAYISEFTSSIVHVSGLENTVADTLSHSPSFKWIPPPSPSPSAKCLLPPPSSPSSKCLPSPPLSFPCPEHPPVKQFSNNYSGFHHPKFCFLHDSFSTTILLLYDNHAEFILAFCSLRNSQLWKFTLWQFYSRPLLAEVLHKPLFYALHNVFHPGVRGSQRLISACFVWLGLARDFRAWAKACL